MWWQLLLIQHLLNQQKLNQDELNQQQTLPFSSTKPNAGDLTDPQQDQQPTQQRQIKEMNAPQRQTQLKPVSASPILHTHS